MKFRKNHRDVAKRLTATSLALCMAFGGIETIPLLKTQEIATTEVLANTDVTTVDLTGGYGNANTGYSTSSYDLGIAGNWAESYMQNMYNRGLMTGDENGKLNPSDQITRAEFVAITNRAFGYSEVATEMPFEDVVDSAWYSRDINVAYNQGYFSGISETAAAPEAGLTREQTVALLSRNLNLQEAYHEADKFVDSKDVSTWATGSVNTATDKGYLSGYEDGSFRPNDYITRAEVSKIVTVAVGHLIDTPSTQTLGYVRGNVTIASTDVILKDSVIDGDLFVSAGVGSGTITLEGVVVMGEVVISGTGYSHAGQSSVQLVDSAISKLTIAGVEGSTKTVATYGETIIDTVVVKTSAFLEEATYKSNGFREIILDGAPGTTLNLAGIFDDVWVVGEENNLNLNDGMIDTLIIDEEAVGSVVNVGKNTYVDSLLMDAGIWITGLGELGYVKVNAPGAIIDIIPDYLEIAPGITATVGGQVMGHAEAEALSSSPRILSSYPIVDPVTGTGGTAQVKANKGGTIRWAITLAADGPATADELMRMDPLNYKLLSKGLIDLEFEQDLTFELFGLEKDTEYVLSVLLVDIKGESSAVRYEYFVTADDTASSFAAGFPILNEISSTWITFDVVFNRTAELYWAVYPPDLPAPTASALRNGDISSAVSSNKAEADKQVVKLEKYTFLADGLEPVTDYILYTLAADGNNTSEVIATPFKTIDTTPPVILTVRSVKDTDTSPTEMQVTIDEYAFVYYAVYPDTVSFPIQDPNYVDPDEVLDPDDPTATPDDSVDTIEDTEEDAEEDTEEDSEEDTEEDDGTIPYIELQSDEAKQQVIAGTLASLSGVTKAYDAKEEIIFELKGLDTTKAYNIYMVAEDPYGNLSALREEFVPVQPAFMEDYPIAVFSTDDDEKLEGRTPTRFEFKTIKESNAYWVVMEGHKNTAPTAEELINLDLMQPPYESMARGVTNIPAKNVKYTSQSLSETIYQTEDIPTYLYGLEEVQQYTLYVVLLDLPSNGKLYSQVYEHKFTTPDSTVPHGTTRFENNSVTGIDVVATADENVTMYYSMVYSGAALIVPPDDYEVPEILEEDNGTPYYSDLWGDAIIKNKMISGFNARKFGKQTLKENIDTTVKLTGLLEEQSYDFYYLFEDSTGNRSDIQLLKDISTLDATPPNASLEFTDVDFSGQPSTLTGITIAFDEVVEGYVIDPVSGMKSSKKFTDMTEEEIMSFVEFYQITDYDPKVEMKPIVSENYVTGGLRTPGVGKYYTTITFIPEAYELISNGTYYFVLNNIQDVSGNEMVYSNVDLQFTTEPPMINFLNLLRPTTDKQFTYKLTPQNVDVADNMYFDVIVHSTETILFDLYQYNTVTFEYDLVGVNLSVQGGTSKGLSQLWEAKRDDNGNLVVVDGEVQTTGRYVSPSWLYPGKDPGATYDTYGKNKGYHEGEYAIAVKQINSKDIELGVETDLYLNLYGVMGPESVVVSYAQNSNPDIHSPTFAGLSIVSYVTANIGNGDRENYLEMAYGFTDSIPPEFEADTPSLRPGSNSVGTQVQSDKSATFHYVIIPKALDSEIPQLGQLRFPDADLDGSGMYETLNANGDNEWSALTQAEKDEIERYGQYSLTSAQLEYLMITGSAYTTSDAQAGSIEGLYPSMKTSTEYLGDLLPATPILDEKGEQTYDEYGNKLYIGVDYDFYGFLKGDAAETSIVYYERFETVLAEAPTLTAQATSTGETQTTIRFVTDVEADVYYMLVQQGSGLTGDPDQVTPNDIMGENGQVAIERGNTTTSLYNPSLNEYYMNVTLPTDLSIALEEGVTYHVYAVANAPGSIIRSNIAVATPIHTMDLTGPMITDVMASPQRLDNLLDDTFKGDTVTIKFDEGLYLNENAGQDPLTGSNVSEYIFVGGSGTDNEVRTDGTSTASIDTPANVKYFTTEVNPRTGAKAITSIIVSIGNNPGVKYGQGIYSNQNFYDENGNNGKKLSVKLYYTNNPQYDATTNPTVARYMTDWRAEDGPDFMDYKGIVTE